MPQPRILYFSHDTPHASGGVRTLYQHVQHLVRSGIPAFVVQGEPGFRASWFQDDLPTLYYKAGLHIQFDDVLVIPEDHRELLEVLKTQTVRKLIFCQNHFYIFTGMDGYRSWDDLGISGVFASSDVIARFLESHLGCEKVPVVHYAIDHQRFQPRPKKLQIAYMPRKLAADLHFIRNLAMRLLGPEGEIPWVAIDGRSESEVAQLLAESAIFLSLSHLEGFGLPPVEAMASGCLVTGFHGHGGLEYATAENGLWCTEGDLVDCSHKLAQAVNLVRDNRPEVRKMVEAGERTAARYTFERQERELLAFFRDFLAKDWRLPAQP